MKLCFVVTEDWYFCSHRLPLAEEALSRGWAVFLVTRVNRHGEQLTRMGVKTIHLDVDRGGVNPLRELSYCLKLARIYRQVRPDVVHHVAMKPVLYGSLAAWLTGQKAVVNAVAGLGSVFTSNSLKTRLVRPWVKLAFKALLGRSGCRAIVQNEDDLRELKSMFSLPDSSLTLIRGSGVDMDEFCPPAEKKANPIPLVGMVSRLLIEKGVRELIEAARLLKERGVPCRVALVGDADEGNIHAVSKAELERAAQEGWVEVWGRRSNIAQFYQEADIATLPSYYREGIPKTLIEACAAGLPIVTTDSVGCRETVDHEKNGLLVEPRQVEALADALGRLLSSAELRERMGDNSREKALAEFDIKLVVEQTFAIYGELT